MNLYILKFKRYMQEVQGWRIFQKKSYHMDMEEIRYEIFSQLKEIPDPRVDQTQAHSLPTLLFIALCTFLTGGKSFYEMELFADAHKSWLKRVGGMVRVPNHDTFNRDGGGLGRAQELQALACGYFCGKYGSGVVI